MHACNLFIYLFYLFPSLFYLRVSLQEQGGTKVEFWILLPEMVIYSTIQSLEERQK